MGAQSLGGSHLSVRSLAHPQKREAVQTLRKPDHTVSEIDYREEQSMRGWLRLDSVDSEEKATYSGVIKTPKCPFVLQAPYACTAAEC